MLGTALVGSPWSNSADLFQQFGMLPLEALFDVHLKRPQELRHHAPIADGKRQLNEAGLIEEPGSLSECLVFGLVITRHFFRVFEDSFLLARELG